MTGVMEKVAVKQKMVKVKNKSFNISDVQLVDNYEESEMLQQSLEQCHT